MEENNKLVPMEHGNQRILTTAQLVKFYGTTGKLALRNFQRNKDRYIEGKHFYRVEGELLQQFKENYPEIFESIDSQIDDQSEGTTRQIDAQSTTTQIVYQSKRAPFLYLWTEKGALMHAKSLNTDQAWSAYETLVDDYYRRGDEIVALQTQLVQLAQQNVELLAESNENMDLFLQALQDNISAGGQTINPGNRLMQEADIEDWVRVYVRITEFFRWLDRTKKPTPSENQTLQQLLKDGLKVMKSHLKHLEDHEPIGEAIWGKAYFGVQEAKKHQQVAQEQIEALQGIIQQAQTMLPPAQHKQIAGPEQGEEA